MQSAGKRLTFIKLSPYRLRVHLMQVKDMSQSLRHSQGVRKEFPHDCCFARPLRRFDVPGPRYTSYPTADRFVEAFGQEDYVLALQQRRSGTLAKAMPLSRTCTSVLRILCYYCACNKIITKHHDRAEVYLRYLSREIDLHTAHCGVGQVVSQLHLGGTHAHLPIR